MPRRNRGLWESSSMKRREFGASLVGAAFIRPAAAQGSRAPRKNALMHVGGDYHSVAGGSITSRENLEYNLRYGVKHLTAQIRKRGADGAWDGDELKKMRDSCEARGAVFEAIRMEPDYITLPKGDARERAIATIQGNIEKAANAGVKLITYHWTVIPIRRNK